MDTNNKKEILEKAIKNLNRDLVSKKITGLRNKFFASGSRSTGTATNTMKKP